MEIDLLFIFTLLSIFAILSLAIIVWVSRANSTQKISFVTFGVAVSLFLGLLYYANIDVGEFWNTVNNKGVFVVAPWMVYSVDLVISNVISFSRKIKVDWKFYLTLLLSVFAATPYFIERVVIKDYSGVLYPSLVVSDWVYWPFILLVVLPIIFLFFRLYKGYKTLAGYEGQRARTLLISTVLVFVFLISSNVILPSFGLNEFSSFAPFWMLFWAFSIYYSIANQRLFGIRHIASQLLSYSINGIFLIFFFFLFYYLLSFLGLSLNLSTAFTFLPPFILIAMLFPAYSRWAGRFVGKLLNLKTEDDDSSIELFVDSLSRSVTLKDIFNETSLVLRKLFQVEGYSLFLFNKGEYLNYKTSRYERPDAISKKLFRLLSDRNFSRRSSIFLLDEISQKKGLFKEVVEIMKENKIEVIARIFDNNRYIGIGILSSREDATAYSAEEYAYMKQVFSNVTIAIGRSLLFEDIQIFNRSLQERVEVATADLRKKNLDLKNLRDRERDMMDIIGHELRTPLSIIKMKLGLLDMKFESGKKISPPEFKNEYVKIMEAIQREGRLLETMISSTKIDSNHLELHYEKLDLIEVLKEAVEFQKAKAQKKGLELRYHGSVENYYIYGDKVRLPEVFDNIIGNAIKYTDEGKIDVYCRINKNRIEVEVKDTGIGIPEKSIKKLGTKFYRVGQYIQGKTGIKESNVLHIVRPGGTGLGLYVTFGLIKLMKGNINVESKVGLGSSFTVSFPQFNGKMDKISKTKFSKNVFEQLGLHNNNNNI